VAQNDLIDRIAAIVGPKGLLRDAAAMEPHLIEDRGLYRGTALAVVKPATTEEVAAVVRICAGAGVTITPQGGNTGHCGGGVPDGGIVLCLSRMNHILEIDPVNYTMTIEAGCVLQDIKDAADDAGCLFPLSLGAKGSCQIGGNLSTNAGGTNALRYGSARDMVLGLEAVIADGRIWNGMRPVLKDNSGYSLKNLLIGSEGTLGIITRAVLKLYPAPQDVHTALCGLERVEDGIELLSRARRASGDAVTAFEMIPQFGMDIVARHIPDCISPLKSQHPWDALIEFSSPRADSGLGEAFAAFLESAFEDDLIKDAVLAESQAQAQQMWRIRESMSEAQKYEGGSIKHDVSVPVSHIPEFIARAVAAVTKAYPGIRPLPFGHIGDGNIHFNFSQPLGSDKDGADKEAFLRTWGAVNEIVHGLVAEYRGSIAAEHGVGQLKVEKIRQHNGAVENDMMIAIKRALDPANTLNPGKVVRLS